MCGVFGYAGPLTNVGAKVVHALRTLEYRGYDSWGIAVSSKDGIVVNKDVGRINGHVGEFPSGNLGIGHTRRATHGGVTEANAHPHLDCSGRVAIVHNGIIENHHALRSALIDRGHQFASETDSEVVAHLVEERLATGLDLAAATAQVFDLLEGYNAVVVLDHQSQQFAVAKHVSPLVIGLGPNSATVASDAIALHDQADRLIYLEDGQLALLANTGVEVLDLNSLQPAVPTESSIQATAGEVGHGGYPDFMSKEMAEQPDTLRRIVREARAEIEALASAIEAASQVILVGCGTAGNAALAGSYVFDAYGGRQVSTIPASEFRYRARAIDKGTLVIALSQSGETVDVLDAVALAQRSGARVAAVVNTPFSTLDRTVETTVHLRAGAEQCVLATKSYTAKLAVLLLTACSLTGRWSEGQESVLEAASSIESTLSGPPRGQIRQVVSRTLGSDHLFVIGRGIHFPSALEAALKIKEVSYIHAEGFASGELKHGVIALVSQGTPCLVLAPNDETRTDVLSGAAELRSRGGHIIGVGSSDDPGFDDFIHLPDAGGANFIAESVAGQLFGYFAALARGNDPDRPRNLAKSVTVK